MKCLFCRSEADAQRSFLDTLQRNSPDMWEVTCKEPTCGLRYHVCGSTKTVLPDLSRKTETRNRVKRANANGIPISLVLGRDEIRVREHPKVAIKEP